MEEETKVDVTATPEVETGEVTSTEEVVEVPVVEDEAEAVAEEAPAVAE